MKVPLRHEKLIALAQCLQKKVIENEGEGMKGKVIVAKTSI